MYLFSVCTNITEVKSPIAEAISKGAKVGRVISQAIQTIFDLFFFQNAYLNLGNYSWLFSCHFGNQKLVLVTLCQNA